MFDNGSFVPSSNIGRWQEANACLAKTIGNHGPALTHCRRQARQTRRLLESLFPLMEDLCRRTCPDCTDICCRRAWVWADFRDLLFFHLAGISVPERQLVSRQGDHCRYAGPAGCRLDRLQRPFVCTWYICPAQTRLLDNRPGEKRHLVSALEQIKTLRKQMEESFIRVVV
ncbi:hypothetical protein DSCW_34290 [Desulfosarcina widdelii]|uniref:Uncharacterized protein n=1 Tax=Desulfosarcina widdelii TaxID=947919 RepID=A0A5K7Z200_9BACT|nr:hypothetical protein [Desulfosarcina widdelii]BBO76012.1 hypothetical protein DSCW_34290 [Desulfosarcina widdelii]